MRIRQLHINNFGHFADRDITLSAAPLQVIYGPNEAGKTTLLEFLRCWLFDFPGRTPYDFRAGSEIAGVGTLELADGRLVELRRRKGTKNKVSLKLDGCETPLDETGFQRLIGHANRNLFESVFAFGLDQLSQGEESLKHESLQSALFGGGLGGAASPERIGLELERQAAELFSPTARKPAINALLAEIKELAAAIKDKSLRAADYQTAQEAVAAADAQAAEIHSRVDALRREHAHVEKLARACPIWWKLEQQRTRRAGLSVPAGLPADARQRFATIEKRLADADRDHQQLAEAIATHERELADLRLDPQSVSQRAEIKAALELRQSTVDARRDLPERIADRARTNEQIARELAKLRPGWGHGELKAFSVDVATEAAIDRLTSEDWAIAKASSELRGRLERLQTDRADAEALLAALGEPCDAAPLVAVLADEAAYLADRKQLQSQTAGLANLDRQLAASLRRLTPPLAPGNDSPCNLPVPRLETVAEFDAEFTELNQQLRAAGDSLRDDLQQQSDLQAKLAQLTAAAAVPSLNERDARRRRRDAGWDLVRRRFVEGQPAADDEAAWLAGSALSLLEAYQLSVREADEIADQIYASADAVARREALQRDRDSVATRVEARQTRLDELRRHQADLHARWRALWQPCGFEPLAPAAMRNWLTDYRAAVETASRHDESLEQIAELRQRGAAFENRLRAACAAAEGDVAVLLAAAHQAVAQANEHRRRRTELSETLGRLKPRLAACDRDARTLDERQAAWQAEWQAVLADLHFPVDWPTELARAVIAGLSATRVKLDGLPDDDQRIEAMGSRIEQFEARVRPLCQRLAPELLSAPAELALTKLSDQLDLATEAQKQHDQLKRQLATARQQIERVEAHRAALLSDRSALFAAAEATSEVEFLDVVARCETICTLDADIERLSSEIDLIRAGDDCDPFQQSLEQAQESELADRCRTLTEQLQAAEAEKRETDGAAAVAKSELARLDGSGEAALLAETLARKRAQLAADVDRYVPLLLARHMLGESVRRFERENEPEMIRTVSSLIRQMTADRYVAFDRTGTDRKAIILRRFDGVERTPDQLSTGTREQLYLAIRLAYVKHYCQQNEPLPIVMDDVLVNFDLARARQTLAVLGEIARDVQVLFFTCHPHIVSLAAEVVPGLQPIDLSAATPTAGESDLSPGAPNLSESDIPPSAIALSESADDAPQVEIRGELPQPARPSKSRPSASKPEKKRPRPLRQRPLID